VATAKLYECTTDEWGDSNSIEVLMELGVVDEADVPAPELKVS
jgi:hypothetical protein